MEKSSSKNDNLEYNKNSSINFINEQDKLLVHWEGFLTSWKN